MRFLLLILFSSACAYNATEECNGLRTPDEIADVLWENSSVAYKKRTRPSLAKLLSKNPNANPILAEPEDVNVSLSIISIKEIDQQRGEAEFMLELSRRWNDYRLTYESPDGCYPDDEGVGFMTNDLFNIWYPDIIITTQASEPILIASSFWIYANGDVMYKQTLLLTLSCKLQFKDLPKDKQMCKVIINSLKDNAETLLFGPLKPPITKLEDSQDLHISNSLEWKITDFNSETIVRKMLNQPKYNSYAIFSIYLERKSSYYVQFVIVPVLMMVSMSWSSFFIDRAAVPARVSMSTFCFLTISNFLSSELKNLPRLGGKDAWLLRFMQVSLFFVFIAVVEYVLCNYLYRVEKRLKEARKLAAELKHTKENASPKDTTNGVSESCISENDINITVVKKDMLVVGINKIDRLILKRDGHMLVKDEHVEIFFRYAYPISYSIFCLVVYFKIYEFS